MAYEIDFLAVGEESKSGDAIALRYGSLTGSREQQTVVIIDGGFTDDGPRLVEHVAEWYETRRADIVISTHPDADHINGLKAVVEQMDVGELWMHLPWNHSSAIALAKSHRFSRGRFSEHMTRSLTAAAELEDIAKTKGVEIVEPFTGLTTPDNTLIIVGPTEQFYEEMLAEMERGSTVGTAAAGAVRRIRAMVSDLWRSERLTDEGETTPSNNSSTVTLLNMDEHYALLTGDAGISALENAATVLEALGIATSLKLVQVPHHGSKRNVGPTVLNRILGPTLEEGAEPIASGVVSAARDGAPKHPAKVVTNAFRRRGFKVAATAGRTLLYGHNYDRPRWTPVDPLPFYTQVEEDE